MRTPIVIEVMTRIRATRNDIGTTKKTIMNELMSSAISCFSCGPRMSFRSRNLFGSHELFFTNASESIQSA